MSRALFSGWACPSTMCAMVLSWQPTATFWSQSTFHPRGYGGLALILCIFMVFCLVCMSSVASQLAGMRKLAEGFVSEAKVGMMFCRAQMRLQWLHTIPTQRQC